MDHQPASTSVFITHGSVPGRCWCFQAGDQYRQCGPRPFATLAHLSVQEGAHKMSAAEAEQAQAQARFAAPTRMNYATHTLDLRRRKSQVVTIEFEDF